MWIRYIICFRSKLFSALVLQLPSVMVREVTEEPTL